MNDTNTTQPSPDSAAVKAYPEREDVIERCNRKLIPEVAEDLGLTTQEVMDILASKDREISVVMTEDERKQAISDTERTMVKFQQEIHSLAEDDKKDVNMAKAYKLWVSSLMDIRNTLASKEGEGTMVISGPASVFAKYRQNADALTTQTDSSGVVNTQPTVQDNADG